MVDVTLGVWKVEVDIKLFLITVTIWAVAVYYYTIAFIPSERCVEPHCSFSMDSLIVNITTNVVILKCGVTYALGRFV